MNPAASDTPYLVVIPARYASTRFPGKALADLGGKSVLRRCFEQVVRVVPRDLVVIATDDERIAEECNRHSMTYVMTSPHCLTGTDRVAEVAESQAVEWYINVQGDEPFLDPEGLSRMIAAIHDAPRDTGVINAHAKITNEADFRNPTVPKVVADMNGRLLYISRGAIPTSKDLGFISARRQVGLYAFRRSALQHFAREAVKTPLEQIEDVEILRFLETGVSVQMIEVDSVGIAIDTPDDLMRARALLASN